MQVINYKKYLMVYIQFNRARVFCSRRRYMIKDTMKKEIKDMTVEELIEFLRVKYLQKEKLKNKRAKKK